jgi:hypothetical protein
MKRFFFWHLCILFSLCSETYRRMIKDLYFIFGLLLDLTKFLRMIVSFSTFSHGWLPLWFQTKIHKENIAMNNQVYIFTKINCTINWIGELKSLQSHKHDLSCWCHDFGNFHVILQIGVNYQMILKKYIFHIKPIYKSSWIDCYIIRSLYCLLQLTKDFAPHFLGGFGRKMI